MRALGYTDAKVHRAAIGPKLLSTLFVQAQKQPAASGAQASSRAANTMQKTSTAPSAPPPGHPGLDTKLSKPQRAKSCTVSITT